MHLQDTKEHRPGISRNDCLLLLSADATGCSLMLPPRNAVLCVGSVVELAGESPVGGTWMTLDERKRESSIHAPQRRAQFIAGHWFARCIAAEHFGGTAAEWGIATSTRGRPMFIAPSTAELPIHLSIAHSGDVVAVALAPFAVGVDVEFGLPHRDFLSLAARTLGDAERRAVSGCEGAARAAAFYRFWTLKEAHAKRHGHGINTGLARRTGVAPSTAMNAEAVHWHWDELSVAIAGCVGLQVRTNGLPSKGVESRWAFGTRGLE